MNARSKALRYARNAKYVLDAEMHSFVSRFVITRCVLCSKAFDQKAMLDDSLVSLTERFYVLRKDLIVRM